jgi:hypothetical protein
MAANQIESQVLRESRWADTHPCSTFAYSMTRNRNWSRSEKDQERRFSPGAMTSGQHR